MEVTTGPATVTDMLMAQAGRIQPGLCLALGGEPGGVGRWGRAAWSRKR